MQSCEDTIWWHVYTLGACGAPIRSERTPGHRLRRLTDSLDTALDIGASGLLLGPIFQSSTHGYDTSDYFTIDERLGDEEDFSALITACCERGLRLLLDGVFSHVGDRHPLLARALAEGPDSWAGRLLHIDWSGPYPWYFEGHHDLVRFDHSHDETIAYVADIMTHWLARGIDGWRLDAAYSVDPAFWHEVLSRVRARFPQAYILGEVIHGDYPALVEAGTLSTLTQYELWKSIWSSLQSTNFFELDWTLSRHNEFLERFVPQTFIGNHDVTRIASTLGPQGAVAALAILMTVGGTPSIYYGDERAATGVKEERPGGDDAIRPALPLAHEALGPEAAAVLSAHRELIALRRARPWLTRARTIPIELTNERYRYRASSPTDELEVLVDLAGEHPRIQISEGGAVIWSRG